MQMRHEPRLLGKTGPQRLVDLARIERREAQPRQFGRRFVDHVQKLGKRRFAPVAVLIVVMIDRLVTTVSESV